MSERENALKFPKRYSVYNVPGNAGVYELYTCSGDTLPHNLSE